MTRVKATTRELTESSWLAQTLVDMMEVESDANGYTSKWSCLQVLKIIVNEADNKDNQTIYYQNTAGKLEIVVCDIPSLMQHGWDFDREGMRGKLMGLAERYTDDDGDYTVSVKTTHDLNSATIRVSDLMEQIRYGRAAVA
jgi:hypothetical protein